MTAKTARSGALLLVLDSGASLLTPATLELYDDAMPDIGGDPPTVAPLIVLPLKYPSGTVANGVLTFTSSAPTMVDASGFVQWARLKQAAGDWVADLSVSVVGGGGDLKLENIQIFYGSYLFVNGATLNEI